MATQGFWSLRPYVNALTSRKEHLKYVEKDYTFPGMQPENKEFVVPACFEAQFWNLSKYHPDKTDKLVSNTQLTNAY
jgi:hypothetical protein